MSLSHVPWATKSTLALLASSALLACGTDTAPPPLRNLDRPSEMAFTCFGDLRVDGTVITSGQPLSSCLAHQAGEPPEGQDGVVGPDFFGFVLQPALGTVAVVNVRALGVQDNDPLTPGLNDIPVGSLPVGMEEDRSGCFVLTANSGSCDLAAINVTSALNRSRLTEVNRVPITAPGDIQMLTKPRAIATGPQTEEVGALCPLAAEGLVYISYPDCQLVAAVNPASGSIESGVAFREDGTVELATDADYAACPVQCGEAVVNLAHGVDVDAGVGPEVFEERPVVMEVAPDGSKLYVASESSPFLTIIELDAEGLPTANVRRVRVTGDVGIKRFAVTSRIEMGGDEREGQALPPVGEFQFAYAIATDSTIRVLDLDNEVECDTQVDPRYLALETDVSFLSCMPVGDIRTPPRRFGARGPGIQLPGRFQAGRNGLASLAVPLDIAFANIGSLSPRAAVSDPDSMTGTFAFVTSASGHVFVVNVDDNNYADFENPADPVAVSIPLALPHQLRDNARSREALSTSCSIPSANRTELGARLMDSPGQIIDGRFVSASKLHELPFLRGQACVGEDSLGNPVETIVSELSFSADVATRERSYPDLKAVENQDWSISWEGSLSADSVFVRIDGPPVRKGVVARDGARTLLRDSNSPFCDMGVAEYDIVSFLGCDPLQDNVQCGVGEECYVHPDAPSSVQSGVCVPSDRIDEISGQCRDFFIGRRRFSVKSAAKGELELTQRRRVLRTTPLDGCESAAQCASMALVEPLLAELDHPLEAPEPDPETEFSWACEADPSRAPGPDRCVMACTESADCETGFSCSGERCVEAVVPAAACLLAVQRYQLLAGEAFAVVGSDDGFIHSTLADPDTGACVQGSNPHPLAVARIPLRPEPCDDDDDFTTGPNPCSQTVAHTEDYTPFAAENGVCEVRDTVVRTRDAPAVRFSNPALTFHLVDTETRGDLECRNDQLGEGPAFATPYAGYQILMEVGGGFLPKSVPNLEAALPSRIVVGPSGNIWVLDSGDASAITLGRLFRINPTAAAGFDLTTIL